MLRVKNQVAFKILKHLNSKKISDMSLQHTRGTSGAACVSLLMADTSIAAAIDVPWCQQHSARSDRHSRRQCKLLGSWPASTMCGAFRT